MSSGMRVSFRSEVKRLLAGGMKKAERWGWKGRGEPCRSRSPARTGPLYNVGKALSCPAVRVLGRGLGVRIGRIALVVRLGLVRVNALG